MPQTITPVSPPTISLSVPAPIDGEAANAASLVQFVQPLENDAEAFRLLTYGGGIRRRVKCSGNTSLVIQPLGAVAITVGGVWKVYTHSIATTVSPATITGGLVASTRYWVYAYDNAGALDFTASTTAPDVGLRYMTGNTNYFYVTTLYTDTTPDVLPYTQSDNIYTYDTFTAGGSGVRGNLVLDGGSATSDTAVNFSGCVPVGAADFSFKTFTVSPAGVGASYTAGYGRGSVGFGFNTGAKLLSQPLTTIGGIPGVFNLPASTYSFTYSVSNATMYASVWISSFVL